jgi:hypothetical protein
MNEGPPARNDLPKTLVVRLGFYRAVVDLTQYFERLLMGSLRQHRDVRFWPACRPTCFSEPAIQCEEAKTVGIRPAARCGSIKIAIATLNHSGWT